VLPGAGPVDVDVLGVAREQAFERYILHHCSARPVALRIRLHWCEGILDLLCSAVLGVLGALASLMGSGLSVYLAPALRFALLQTPKIALPDFLRL